MVAGGQRVKGMDKMGEGEWEIQASNYRMNKTRVKGVAQGTWSMLL